MKSYIFQEWHIPSRMMTGIYEYIDKGYPPGSFLTAIFENNFVIACSLADEENLRNIPAYAAFLYNEAPTRCWGSVKQVQNWKKTQRVVQKPDPNIVFPPFELTTDSSSIGT